MTALTENQREFGFAFLAFASIIGLTVFDSFFTDTSDLPKAVSAVETGLSISVQAAHH